MEYSSSSQSGTSSAVLVPVMISSSSLSSSSDDGGRHVASWSGTHDSLEVARILQLCPRTIYYHHLQGLAAAAIFFYSRTNECISISHAGHRLEQSNALIQSYF